MNDPPTVQLDGEATQAALSKLACLHRFVMACGPDGRIRWMSDALTVYAGGERVGDECHELLPDLAEIHLPSCAVAFDLRFVAADRTCRVDVALLRQPASQTDELSVFILRPSRTDEALPEEALEALEARPETQPDFLAAILDNAPDAVVALDASGFVTYANPALEQLMGTPRAELIHRPMAELLTQTSDLPAIIANLAPGGEIQGDLKLRDRWISVSSRPLKLSNGQAAGCVSFLRDVTERRAMQEELEHKNAELESYVDTVSHDLRSPLVSMLGFGKLLRQDYGSLLDETGRHFLDRIEQAGHTMQGLIQDLLELSQIGTSGDTRIWVDPRSVLLQLHAELKPRLDEGEIDLQVPDNPPLVLCDRTRLYQIFSNLIGNAIEHMGERKDACIGVDVVAHADHHQICVRDNGVGIAASDHERIFRVFQSLGRRADGQRTTGMGLAIVKKIAEVNGGSVWVDSSPDQGAAFCLTLRKTLRTAPPN